MFSLAIFDYEKKDIIIARDRSGEKPLFYIIQDSTLKFASELKALFKDPKQKRYLKIESLDRFLALGYVNGENSIIDGIKKLKSGHYLRFNLNTGKFKIFNYWELPYFDTNSKLSLTEITDNCEEILEDSVSRQLLSSDVPVGILLSGGIDSSLVTALASRKLKEVNTFTVTFPGYKKYDESYHSRLIAEYFGTNHQEIEANELNLSHLNDLSTQFDEPIIDSSMIPTFLVSKAISNHCKVALGGDGGDELFGGYSTYSRYLQLQNLNYLPKSLKNIISISSSKFLPTGFKGRNWLMNINCDLKNYIPIPNAPFYKKERLRLFQHFNELKLLPNQIKVNYDKRSDVIQNATRFDFYNYLQEDILVKVDRASMLKSLEIRSPF